MPQVSRCLPGWLWWLLASLSVPLAAFAIALCPAAADSNHADQPKQEFVQAGGANLGDFFAGGTDWLNTGKQITAADLRGHVVLLDFWTLC